MMLHKYCGGIREMHQHQDCQDGLSSHSEDK